MTCGAFSVWAAVQARQHRLGDPDQQYKSATQISDTNQRHSSYIRPMARGDQIYVMRPFVGMEGVYEHHGIDCGDGTVIHYSKRGEATIRRTSMATFAAGKPIFLKTYSVNYIPDIAIQRAESRLGEQQYNLFHNNCEHFATWCKTGRNESSQLASFGIDASQLGSLDARRMIEQAAYAPNPAEAIALFQQATDNIAIAQNRLESEYAQIQVEIETWHKAAQLALKQGKEYLARAALERKVQAKRRASELQPQLDQLNEMKLSISQNFATVQKRIEA